MIPASARIRAVHMPQSSHLTFPPCRRNLLHPIILGETSHPVADFVNGHRQQPRQVLRIWLIRRTGVTARRRHHLRPLPVLCHLVRFFARQPLLEHGHVFCLFVLDVRVEVGLQAVE